MAILDMRDTQTREFRAEHGWSSHLVFRDPRIVYWRIYKVASTSTLRTVKGRRPPNIGPDMVAELRDSGYEVVGLTRHPLARLVSAYHFPGYAPSSFTDLVRVVHTIPDRYVDKHVRSQTWKMPEGIQLFPIEDPTSWERVQDVFKARGVDLLPLPHDNATSHAPWPSFYDDETLRLARERYADDLERLGYE